jgi:hypothetical protein
MISTYPEEWIRHYLAEGYLDDDPVVTELLHNPLPFLWSDIVRPGDLSRRQRQLVEEARAAASPTASRCRSTAGTARSRRSAWFPPCPNPKRRR